MFIFLPNMLHVLELHRGGGSGCGVGRAGRRGAHGGLRLRLRQREGDREGARKVISYIFF